ncbi:MAG: UDP-glucose dehydrogenase family protein [Syntrophothermus sp.]
MERIKIGVVGGLGHIGLIQAACLAALGYDTIAHDKDEAKIKKIAEGKMPFVEPGLEDLVTKAMHGGRLRFTNQMGHLQEADIVYICVGTPTLPTGAADCSQVQFAVEEIARNRSTHAIVAIKSTVPVGTARRLTLRLRERNLSDKVTIVSNPEFLREGAGVDDFWKPARIVVGSEPADPQPAGTRVFGSRPTATAGEAAAKVAGIYSPPGVPVIITSWENAELIKYASNAFLATKISFINEIAHLSEKAGGDIRVVSKGVGLDPRIGPGFLEAGAGFSGPCLEKDLKSLIHQFNEAELEPLLLRSTLLVNLRQRKNLIQKLEDRLGLLYGKQIGVLGMAFKPETDDVRDSHSLPIVNCLLSMGARITVHDPWINGPEQAGLSETELSGVIWASSPYEAADGKDAVLILTAWPEYREIALQKMKARMSKPVVVDGRNLFDPQEMQALGIDYQGVGI